MDFSSSRSDHVCTVAYSLEIVLDFVTTPFTQNCEYMWSLIDRHLVCIFSI